MWPTPASPVRRDMPWSPPRDQNKAENSPPLLAAVKVEPDAVDLVPSVATTAPEVAASRAAVKLEKPTTATATATGTTATADAAAKAGPRFPPQRDDGRRQCVNCSETDTPQWRGQLCNACALWKRNRGTDRPMPLLFPVGGSSGSGGGASSSLRRIASPSASETSMSSSPTTSSISSPSPPSHSSPVPHSAPSMPTLVRSVHSSPGLSHRTLPPLLPPTRPISCTSSPLMVRSHSRKPTIVDPANAAKPPSTPLNTLPTPQDTSPVASWLASSYGVESGRLPRRIEWAGRLPLFYLQQTATDLAGLNTKDEHQDVSTTDKPRDSFITSATPVSALPSKAEGHVKAGAPPYQQYLTPISPAPSIRHFASPVPDKVPTNRHKRTASDAPEDLGHPHKRPSLAST